MLALVREHPGITVAEIAQRLGIDATGLYRVVHRLTEAGEVRKDGRRLYPASSTEPEADSDDGGSRARPRAGLARSHLRGPRHRRSGSIRHDSRPRR
jgi:transposase-like protein